ncbi:hypothetical protein L5515_006974 [Caenorhabditis briggsae]|uniref:Granulins domain-containing protein n=1 Tax=Caenorhabditis briggsae TaxID=6238 RepID=A0AAE9CYS0_CAEBR|nr:hypothetical protein L3Y34_007133 [Caenorhabditis briggsae]UMM33536.1 hypothetical protein L5515_006974 [Caenorhabditis briggsae]
MSILQYFPLLLVLVTLSQCTLEPNLCDEKRTTQCDEYAVCCSLGNEQYGCCPFTGGTCCPGTSHCCPPGFSCTTNGTCKRTSTIEKPLDPHDVDIIN